MVCERHSEFCLCLSTFLDSESFTDCELEQPQTSEADLHFQQAEFELLEWPKAREAAEQDCPLLISDHSYGAMRGGGEIIGTRWRILREWPSLRKHPPIVLSLLHVRMKSWFLARLGLLICWLWRGMTNHKNAITQYRIMMCQQEWAQLIVGLSSFVPSFSLCVYLFRPSRSCGLVVVVLIFPSLILALTSFSRSWLIAW